MSAVHWSSQGQPMPARAPYKQALSVSPTVPPMPSLVPASTLLSDMVYSNALFLFQPES